jgi:hypothetical protein
MANVAIPAANFERIYPTENDIAFADFNGVNGTEVNFTQIMHNRYPKNCILPILDGSGNATSDAVFVTSIGAGLSVNITQTKGRAFIAGRYIELLALSAQNVTVTATKDIYIYLTLNITGTVVAVDPMQYTTVEVVIGAKHQRPANSVLIAFCTSDATNVTQVTDMRPSQFNIPVFFNFDRYDYMAGSIAPLATPQYIAVQVPDLGMRKTFCGMVCIKAATGQSVVAGLEVNGPAGTVNNVITYTAAPPGANDVELKRFFINLDSIAAASDIGVYPGGFVLVRFKMTSAHDFFIANIPNAANTLIDFPNPFLGNVVGTANTWAWKESNLPG